MVTGTAALQRLRAGNARFVAQLGAAEPGPGAPGPADTSTSQRRHRLTLDPTPFAIVLGCSDARVPAEIIFDQGLGDLFVIRVAGNIVAPSQIASVEFAAERFGTRLVVVLGHSRCGAILATLEQLGKPANESRSLRSIVERVRPAVESLLDAGLAPDSEALVRLAVRANIRMSAAQLRHGSRILENLIVNDGLLVVGAEYSLDTGAVEFFDGVPG